MLCASTAGGLILLAAGCGGGGGPTGTDRIDLSDIPRLLRVCEQFKKDCGRFPTKEEGLMALVERPAASDIAAKWKGPYQNDKQVKDPWGHVYAYASPANQRIRIWSVGPDGEAGTRDDYPEAPEVRAPRPSR